MNRINRRTFLKTSAVIGAGVASGMQASSWAQVEGANDAIRHAVIGCGGQGNGHCKYFGKQKGLRIVALCDPDTKQLAGRQETLKKINPDQKVGLYTDIRKLLERDDIDTVSIPTCNHWHALATIWACQAGKDVYVEKPVSHNIWEGRKMVEAARKYDRIVQTGTQKRSDGGLMAAFKYLQGGEVGRILWARGFCYKRRGSIGKVDGPQTVPASVDYDLWCGPAPKKPLMRSRLHYNWHWVWDTGNGDLGNQGIHEMDLARWALGVDALAPAVISIGGRLGYDDDGETANTHAIFLDYKDAPLIFEVRGLPTKAGQNSMDNYRGTRVGDVVQCEGGYFVGGGGGGWLFDNDGKKVKQFKGSGGGSHHENFLKAVRSRKVNDLNADILEGHLSSALCHMGNISHRLGAEKRNEEIAEATKGNAELKDSFERMLAHLEANEVDLKKTPLTLGIPLKLDPKAERFVGEFSEEANRMVKREYRKPFVVPEKV